MSGRQAKADRRTARATEHVLQAHDRLHKNDVAAAHEHIHAALGIDNDAEPAAPLAHRGGFDRAFRDLCQRHGVAAMYVLADRFEDDRGLRLLSGGDADLCTFVDRAMRASPKAVV